MADDVNPNSSEATQKPTPLATEPQQDQPYFVAKTKDEYEATFGPTRVQGKDSYRRGLLEKTGYESEEALIQAAQERREAEDAAKSDLEKEKEAREAAEKTATDRDQSMASLRKEYALRDALRDAEINPKRLNFAMDSAKLDKLEISEGKVTDESLATIVDSYKEFSPEWFGSTGANGGEDIGRSSGPGEGNQPKDLNQQIREAEAAGNFQLAIALKSQLNKTVQT